MQSKMRESIQNLLDNALLEMGKDKARVSSAYKQFSMLKALLNGEIAEGVFNAWLIHHYSDEKGYAVDLVDEKVSLKDAVLNSTLGFFDIQPDGDFLLFTNVLTRVQYAIVRHQLSVPVKEKALCFSRIYAYRGEYILSSYCEFLDERFRKLIVENIFKHYNNTAKEAYYTIDDFVKKQPLLMYSTAEILETLTFEKNDYNCYEVVCKIENQLAFDTFIKAETILPTFFGDVSSWQSNGVRKAEIVILGQDVHFECNSSEDLDWVVDKLNEGNTGLVQIETKMTHLDDLFDS